MEEWQKQALIAEGFEVIELDTPHPYYKTKTFVKFPDGRLLPHYDYLFEIPQLSDGEQFTLSRTAVPEEIRDVDGLRAYMHRIESAGLPIPYVGWILLIILTAVIFIGTYYIIEKWRAPCGTKPYEKPVTECIKVIVMPDCRYRAIDTCKDTDGDGKPDGEWIDPEWQGGPGIPWELILGTIAFIVAAGLIIRFVPPTIFKKKTTQKKVS